MNDHKRSLPWLLLLATGLAALVFGFGAIACGDDDDDGDGGEEPTATSEAAAGEIPTVEITGADYSFQAPASIAGGLTRIVFTNTSSAEDHQAQLLRLNDGVTFDQFTAALPEGEEAVFALVTPAGGPGASAGLQNENVLDLDAGQYALVCLIPSPSDGIPHVAKGMLQPLEVTELAGEQPEAPTADVSVALSNFTFDAPATLPAGETTFDVTNNGPQPHEMAVARLEGGTTLDQLLDIFFAPPSEAPPPEGPPPATFVGQVAVLSDGLSGQTTIDLTAGTYAVLCFVTDPESGAPHAAIGMAQQLTVQ